MAVWLLRPRAPDGTEPWVQPETAQGFIVIAPRADLAREAVAFKSDRLNGPGVEGVRAWLNPDLTECVRLDPDGPTRVVLRDFHH